MKQPAIGFISSLVRAAGRLTTLCCAFALATAGCAEDDGDEGAASETESMSAEASGDGASDESGGGCVDGEACVCSDGSQSAQICTPEPTCWCPDDFGGSTGGGGGGDGDACGTSVMLSGAYDGTFDDQRCGVGNSFGSRTSFTFGAILEPEVFTVTVNAPLDVEPPIEGTGAVFYRNTEFGEDGWETPPDSCAVTVTSIEPVMGRERVAGSVTCPQPASLEGQPDLTIGGFDFVGEIY